MKGLARVVTGLRAALAFIALLLHVLWGLAAAGLILPLLSQAQRNRILRLWSRALLMLCGVRLTVLGEPIEPELAQTGMLAGSRGRLLLANHISWLDIYAMNAVVPTRFIAKSEIGRWPVLGTLVSLMGTLYVERGRRHAVHAINQSVAKHLAQGETIGIYPEGTTTDGRTLLPFHANLVQPALDLGSEVRPLALRYLQAGQATLAAAYIGDDTLLQSMWRVLMAPRLEVQVHWLPPVPLAATRQATGAAARAAIAAALGIDISAPPASPHSAAAGADAAATAAR